MDLQLQKIFSRKTSTNCNAFPRDCNFAYMTSTYYATGFRILEVYKTEINFTEMRSLLFLEETEKTNKWELLKSRIPLSETRITDLPGTRNLHYNNYCLRSLTPECSKSWRKSVLKSQFVFKDSLYTKKNDYKNNCC